MKRFVCLLLSLSVLFLCACQDSGSSRRRRDGDLSEKNYTIPDETLPAPYASTEETDPFGEIPKESETVEPSASAEPTSPAEPTEPAQTEEPTEPEIAVRENVLERFSSEDWKRINLFLSNFSEIRFGNFDPEDPLENWSYEAAMFAFLHLKINDRSKLSYEGEYCKLSRENMDTCLNRFFGRTIEPDSYSIYDEYGYIREVGYRDGSYFIPVADGEAYNYISVPYAMYRQEDGSYEVLFDVFELDLDEYFDRGIDEGYYSMTIYQASSAESLTYVSSGTALVCDYTRGSFRSYQLIRYSLD